MKRILAFVLAAIMAFSAFAMIGYADGQPVTAYIANYDEAEAAIKKMDRGHCYDDHAVRFRDGRKIYWLVKCEWHC